MIKEPRRPGPGLQDSINIEFLAHFVWPERALLFKKSYFDLTISCLIFRNFPNILADLADIAQDAQTLIPRMSRFAFKREICVLSDMIFARFAFKREI